MKSHKENYLKINSYGNEKLCAKNSFLISNSPELSNNNLKMNYVNSPRNVNHLNNKRFHQSNSLASPQRKNSIDENNLHSPELLNQTSFFPQNDILSNFQKSISSISNEEMKINSLEEQITFKQKNTEEIKNNSKIKYRIEINDNSDSSLDKNKTLLNTQTIQIYTKLLLLKLFHNYLKVKKPIIYGKKTEDKKIMGFAALNYDNNYKNDNQISIDINICDENKNDSLNYFFMYNKNISLNLLKYFIRLDNVRQVEMAEHFKKDIFILKIQKRFLTVLNNYFKDSPNFLSIISSLNGQDIKILNKNTILEFNKNFDFIIIFNSNILKNISYVEINKIIYNTLKNIIVQEKSFDIFLNETLINICRKVIENDGKSSISIIFICMETILTIFENKDLEKIEQILILLENTTYENDPINRKLNQFNYSNNQSTASIINNEDCINLTFDKKSFSKEIDNIIEINQKKKLSIFKCCGI